MLLSVMVDANSGSPSSSKAAGWASALGLDHPVTADTTGEAWRFLGSYFPTYMVIDREMTIVEDAMWPWRDSTITGLF